jgi:hypothetical protein
MSPLPLWVLQWGPLGERCPFPELFFTYSSGSPIKELPLQVSLAGTPLREIFLSTTLFYISLGVPNKKKLPGKISPSSQSAR